MGYFANGSEGESYRERYCDRCINDRFNDCPIWNEHLENNYKECNNPASLLHRLIPRGESGENLQCKMFVEKP
jgi:hypothetical protein